MLRKSKEEKFHLARGFRGVVHVFSTSLSLNLQQSKDLMAEECVRAELLASC